MVEEYRPDPDALLARVQAEEAQKARGKLKIFLGYAAGVGKTYAMLEAARSRKAEGIDVVVAVVETHGRAETEALLTGLEIVPRRRVEYRGVSFTEMDVDAVLTRRPQLALVDEHAHTNAPDSRHPKRWQDIEEILNAGIDVYTTLNIQHLESFRDIIAQTTGVMVRETIPDRVVDEAAEIEIIDLPPEELLQRMREGKIYIPEQAARAIDNFFEEGNLIALREIALRRAANRVDEQMREYLRTYSAPGILPVADRILVCISGSPNSEHLIRTARRLAEELKTDWYALYVETPENDRLTAENRERIWRDLRLAESLGAKEAVTSTADSFPDAVIDFARKHQITKVLIGRSIRPRWRQWVRGSVLEQILRGAKEMDVYVIGSTGKKPAERISTPLSSRETWRRYLAALLLVAGATIISEFAIELLSPTSMVMFYLLAVLVAALRLGFKPALVTAFVGVFAFDFFLIPPYYSFAVSDTQYLIIFISFLIVGAVISTLVARARAHTETIRVREAQTTTLYAFSRELSSAVNLKEIIDVVVHHVSDSFEAQAAVLLPEGESLKQAGPENVALGEKQISVALWAFRNRQMAGRGTDTLSSAEFLYLPLQAGGKTAGVLTIKLMNPNGELSPEDKRLLEAFASQAAFAIERAQLAQRAEEVQLIQATERLERSLLKSISHDLRTPLSSIMGALSSLRDEREVLDVGSKRELTELALEEAGRMNRFISNLLDVTRLESGALKVRKEPYDVQDLLGSSVAALEPRVKGKKIQLRIPPDVPLVPMDSVLMSQVVMNLLDNALKYSPAEGTIEVSAATRNGELEIAVADQGPGIPPEHLTQIFNKFFRLSRNEETSGTGLGLAICRGIVEAHGGRIWAENRPEGGSRVIFRLPLGPLEAENGSPAVGT